MNLYDLQKEVNTKRAFLKNIIETVKELRYKLESPKVTKFDKIAVQGHGAGNPTDEIITRLSELESMVIDIERELELKTPLIRELEAILREFNDIDQLIYVEYHLKGYSAIKLAQKYNYSVRQIYNIIKRVEDRLKDCTKVRI